jgi:hypothetical protein
MEFNFSTFHDQWSLQVKIGNVAKLQHKQGLRELLYVVIELCVVPILLL